MTELAALGSSSGSNGLSIIDITDPAAPVRVGGVSGFNADDLTWHGDYLVVAHINGSAFRVIDASDPTTPVEVASIVAGTAADPDAVMDSAHSVRMLGNYAVVASNIGGPDTMGAVGVVDMSTPTAPVITGYINSTTSSNPDALYNAISVEVNDTYAVVGNNSGYISVIDVLTDPTTPSIVGSLLLANPSQIWGLDVLGDLAVVGVTSFSSPDAGIALVDISNPAAPTVVGRLRTSAVPGLHGAQRISIIDSSTAVVSGRFADSVVLVDISTPSAPSLIGVYSDATKLDHPMESEVSGDYAFVVGWATDNLVVLDISMPANPTFVTQLVDATNFNAAYAFEIKPAPAPTSILGPTVGYIGPGAFMG